MQTARRSTFVARATACTAWSPCLEKARTENAEPPGEGSAGTRKGNAEGGPSGLSRASPRPAPRPARPGAALSCAQTAAEEARGGRAKQGFGGMGRVMEPDTHARAWPGEPPDARRGPWDRFSRHASSLDGRRTPQRAGIDTPCANQAGSQPTVTCALLDSRRISSIPTRSASSAGSTLHGSTGTPARRSS